MKGEFSSALHSVATETEVEELMMSCIYKLRFSGP